LIEESEGNSIRHQGAMCAQGLKIDEDTCSSVTIFKSKRKHSQPAYAPFHALIN